jgi:hypothetical protein
MRRRTLRALRLPSATALSVAVLVTCALSSAQTPPTPPTKPHDNGQAEMRQLFAKVERRMREIDRLLSDAGAGDTAALAGAKKAGIDELLKNTQARQHEVLDDIDRILEIARQSQGRPSSGSGGQGEQQPDGASPLDKQGEQQTDRESTPSSPQKGEKPGGRDKSGEKPEPDANKPNDPNADGQPNDQRRSPPKDARNNPSSGPPAQPTSNPSAIDRGKDRWGDLPVKVRDVFRAEGGGDMPAQYREWIDAYYRRLSKKP